MPQKETKLSTWSKTIWVNLIVFGFSLATFLQGSDFIQQYPQAVAAIGMVVGVLGVVLRFLTKVPISFIK